MEILKRLGFVIHWLGFVLGGVFSLMGMLVFFFNDSFFESIGIFLMISGLGLLVCFLGWVIRYIFSGKVNFFPWLNG